MLDPLLLQLFVALKATGSLLCSYFVGVYAVEPLGSSALFSAAAYTAMRVIRSIIASRTYDRFQFQCLCSEPSRRRIWYRFVSVRSASVPLPPFTTRVVFDLAPLYLFFYGSMSPQVSIQLGGLADRERKAEACCWSMHTRLSVEDPFETW